jgi:hypothetical protein
MLHETSFQSLGTVYSDGVCNPADANGQTPLYMACSNDQVDLPVAMIATGGESAINVLEDNDIDGQTRPTIHVGGCKKKVDINIVKALI